MGLLNDVMVANKLVRPTEKGYDRVGATIANSVTIGGQAVDPLGSTADFLRTYATIEWVYAAVKAISDNIAKLPFKVYVDLKDGEKKDITDDPRLKLFQKPHPFKTRFMFWSEVIGYLKLSGECFCYLVRPNDKRPPEQIIPLRPDRIQIVPDSKDYIKGYVYTVNGADVPLEPWEVYHVAYFNPIDDYRGLSPLQAARNDLILELNSVTWAKDLFKNGTRLEGVLQVPESLDQKQFDRIRKQFKANYSEKKETIAVLEQGTEFHSIALNPKDAEFISQRKISKAGILSVYGVPPIMVMDLTDSSVLQNTEIQRKIFWEETLVPTMQMFLDEWNTELMPMFGVEGAYCEFDLSKVTALQESVTDKSARYTAAFDRGAVTPNEIRVDVLGKEELPEPGMDTTYMPMNYIPSTSAGDTFDMPEKSYQKKNVKAVDQLRAIRKDMQWRVFVARTIPLERKFASVLKDVFEDLKKEVVSNFKKTKSLKVQQEGALFNPEKWADIFRKKGRPLLAEAITRGGDSVLQDLKAGKKFDLTNPFVMQTINDRLQKYGIDVVNTTNKDISSIIAAGLKNGETIEQTASKIADKFDQYKGYRANRIARTEMVGGFNAGNLDGMRQSGVVEKHEWLTKRDGDVRDSHQIDGIAVEIGKDFPLSKDYTGESRAYPSDFNERCTTIPVRE